MKTTERHELKHNEVADTLQETLSASNATARPAGRHGRRRRRWASSGAATRFTRREGTARPAPCWRRRWSLPRRRSCRRSRPRRDRPRHRRQPDTYPTEAAQPRSRGAEVHRRRRRVPEHAGRHLGPLSGGGGRWPRLASRTTRGRSSRQSSPPTAAASTGGWRGSAWPISTSRPGKFDPAIATLRELSLDARGDLPVDAILVQLAQAYVAAGKKTEAQQALTRVTTEFATSPYAADAKQAARDR